MDAIFDFSNSVKVDAEGILGDMILIWIQGQFLIDIISRQEIHFTAKVNHVAPPLLFSTIYSSTNRRNMSVLWENLKTIDDHFSNKSLPWPVLGDFQRNLTQL